MRRGTLQVLAAYGLWGVLPIYWKAMAPMPSSVIMAHRILWALVFTACLVPALGYRKAVLEAMRDRGRLVALAGAAVLITVNWWLYIWAVAHDRIIETAFGYYITPILSMLLGLFVQKERFTRPLAAAIVLALVGVAVMAAGMRGVPWVSLVLATSFGLYGLFKKRATLPAIPGLMLETLISLPLALGLLVPAALHAHSVLGSPEPGVRLWLLCIFAGPATAIPLGLFSAGAQRIPMVRLGFAQYLSPTIAFLVGLFVYHESFSSLKALAFGFIWAAVAVFMVGEVLKRRRVS